MIIDPVRRRLVVFGGWASPADGASVWTCPLDGGYSWTRLTGAGTPPPGLAEHCAIYDPVRDRMLVLSGSGTGGGVWALSLSGTPIWSLLEVAGTPPDARERASAVYDPVRDRVLLFGGFAQGATNGCRADVWALSLAGAPEWVPLSPAGNTPVGRYDHAAVYDPIRDAMLVFGGSDSTMAARDDAWTLSLAGEGNWAPLEATGSVPAGRVGAVAVYDPQHDQIVLQGGATFADGPVDQPFTLQLAPAPRWSAFSVAPDSLLVRQQHAACYDPSSGRMLVFGGLAVSQVLGDLRALDLSAPTEWTALDASAVRPMGRYGHVAIFDAARTRMVMFGGWVDSYYKANDTWALSLAGSPSWTQLSPVNAPVGRAFAAAAYDGLRDRMLMFGGIAASYVNETWALTLGDEPAWTQLQSVGTPPSARSTCAIYDPVRDRMLIFGGFTWATGFANDVWQLSLSGAPNWSPVATQGTPPTPRTGQVAIYDPVRDRMIVYGGRFSTTNETWALTLSGVPTWSQLQPTGSTPTVQTNMPGMYDAIHDRILIFGGSGASAFNDVWSLGLGSAPEWTLLQPVGVKPGTRTASCAVYDPLHARMLIFGGRSDAVGYMGDLWELDMSEALSVERESGLLRGLRLLPPSPNPAHSEVTLRFAIDQSARAEIAIYDVCGRRIREFPSREWPAGENQLEWNAHGDDGHVVSAGVYFLRVRTRGAERVSRFVVKK